MIRGEISYFSPIFFIFFLHFNKREKVIMKVNIINKDNIILLKPINNFSAEKLFERRTLLNNYILTISILDNKLYKDYDKGYYHSLKTLSKLMSDDVHRFMLHEIDFLIKKEFAKEKPEILKKELCEDIYGDVKEKETILFFSYKTDEALFLKYISFYKNYVKEHFNYDPMEFFEEEYYIKELALKNKKIIEVNLTTKVKIEKYDNDEVCFKFLLDKDMLKIKNLYNLLGSFELNIEILDDVKLKNRNKEKMYRASLKDLSTKISLVSKKISTGDLHNMIKYLFAEYKYHWGVDIYNYYDIINDEGVRVKVKEVPSFDKNISGVLYDEFINFYQEFCICKFNYDPFVDVNEKKYIKKLLDDAKNW